MLYFSIVLEDCSYININERCSSMSSPMVSLFKKKKPIFRPLVKKLTCFSLNFFGNVDNVRFFRKAVVLTIAGILLACLLWAPEYSIFSFFRS